jgi:hypothetical protein
VSSESCAPNIRADSSHKLVTGIAVGAVESNDRSQSKNTSRRDRVFTLLTLFSSCAVPAHAESSRYDGSGLVAGAQGCSPSGSPLVLRARVIPGSARDSRANCGDSPQPLLARPQISIRLRTAIENVRSKSSRWRGRHRQHASRVRSPELRRRFRAFCQDFCHSLTHTRARDGADAIAGGQNAHATRDFHLPSLWLLSHVGSCD